MIKLESIQDQMQGFVTYKLDDGRCVRFDQASVNEFGLAALMSHYGVEIPASRAPVFQRGRKIGTLPSVFEPMAIKSTSFLYDVRPGDFRRSAEGWIASDSLGPGDFECIPEFAKETAQ